MNHRKDNGKVSIFRSFQRILKMAFVAMVLCFVTSVSFGDISCNCTNGNGASGCYGTPVKDPTGDGNNMSCIYNWSCQNGYYTYPTTTQTSETSYTATCDPIDYGITYYLDGGSWPSNNPTNPSTYNIETQTFTISTPTKTGYVFVGWCEDAALTTNCSQTKTITTGSTEDRAYYAKWSCDTGYHRQNFDFDLNITTEGTSSNYDSNTNTWEVFFGDETPEFTLSGSALCSTYNGNESATEAQIQAGANPQQADVCWCKLTSYTDNNNTTINPSDQLWVKQGLWYTPASCRQSCATNCAKQVSDNALFPGFARQLFNAANDSCVPDAGTITYNCGQQPGSTTQTGTVPSPQSVEFGGEYDLAANSCAYAGYHFIGWNCSHNLDAGTAPQGGYTYSFDGTAANAPSFTYQVSGNNSAVTCTAQWTQITHTITVDRDGGNGAIIVTNGGTPETVSANSTTFTCNEGDTVTFPGWGADNSLTKTGYVFTGWNEGNTALNAGISCDADRTITAQWAQCTCTDGSHSTCGNTASVSNNTCSYGFTCDTHYNYNNASSGTVPASAAGVETVQAPDCSPITYTITFKTSDSVMDTQTCTYGQSVSLNPVSTMSNIPVSSQYGWSFGGWTNVVPAQNPMQPSYTNGQTITCTGDMTLYGIWRRCGTFDYYENGVTGQSMCIQHPYENTSSTTASEHNVTAPDLSIANSTMHTTYGWDVLGWMLNDSTAVTDPVLTPHTVQSPGVNQLWHNYALYQRSVGITYNGNGADGGSTLDTNCGTQSLSGNSTDADALNCNFASNGYTRTGYTFAGWNTEANGTGISYTAGQHAFPNTNRESNPTLTLYAQWTINQHNVTYAVGNHAASGSSDYVVNNVNYGSTHTVLANTAANIAPDTGYAFQNWDCGVMGTKTAGNTFTMPDANVTCTAQWNCASGYIWNSGHTACELQTYTVTYDGGDSNNDGTGVAPYETVADDTYAPATNVVLPDGAFYIADYELTGWNCVETGTNNSVTVTSTTANNVTTYGFAMPNANVTCTAQWTEIQYSITYKDGGTVLSNLTPISYLCSDVLNSTVSLPTLTDTATAHFVGWCETPSCYTSYTTISPYWGCRDLMLYAKWEPIIPTCQNGYVANVNPLVGLNVETGTQGQQGSWGAISSTGVSSGNSTAYDLTQNGTWGTGFSYGNIVGEARCSSTNDEFTARGNPVADNGNHCWCRVTSYKPDGTNSVQSAEGSWVRGYESGACDASCAQNCGYITAWNADFRAGLFTPATFLVDCDPIDYTITYDLDDGSWPNNPVNPNTYNIETPTFTISTPTKTGYVFDKWCEDAALTTNCESTKTITIGSTGNRTFYAKWQKNNYDITYDCNGGTVVGSNTTPAETSVTRTGAAQYYPSSTYSFETVGSVCEREYYTPQSWNCSYTDSNNTSHTVTTGDTVQPYNVTCLAVWDTGQIYLSWEPNNGETIETPNMCTWGGSMTGIQQPTKTGYTFTGWYLACLIPSTLSSANVDAYVAKPLNGGSDDTYGGATAETYGITEPGEWGSSWENGDQVTGEALCSSTQGIYATSGDPANNDGKYCWCRATHYKAQGLNQCELSPSLWVGAVVSGTGNDPVASCKASCASWCAFWIQNDSVYRTALFGENVATP